MKQVRKKKKRKTENAMITIFTIVMVGVREMIMEKLKSMIGIGKKFLVRK